MAGVTKNFLMVFERYIPEIKNYDGILFPHQPLTSGQPLKIVKRHMAQPVHINFTEVKYFMFCKQNNFFVNPISLI